MDRKTSPLWISIVACLMALTMIGVITGFTASISDVQASSEALTPPANKHVLILRSYGYGREGPERYNHTFVATLIAGGISAEDIMVEYLDLNRNQGQEFRTRKRELLMHQYAHRKIDLIVAVEQPALNFLLKELKELHAGVPVMAITAKVPPSALTKGRHFVQKAVNLDFKGTLDRALELFPRTRRVLIVTGTGEQDLTAKAQSQQVAALWQNRITFEYTDHLAFMQILKRVESLPPNTIVIFRTFNRDITGASFVPYEAVVKIAKAANAPVFGLFDNYVGIGVVGGSVYHIQREAEGAAREALAILSGKMRLTTPLTELSSPGLPMFDAQQIERWGGSMERLPRESIIINRPLTLWGQYKLFVIGALGVILILSSLIMALILQIYHRSCVEMALRESEERYRLHLEESPDPIFSFTPAGQYKYVNRAFAQGVGKPAPDIIGKSIWDVFPKEEADKRFTSLSQVFRTKEEQVIEVRVPQTDGDRYFVTTITPITDTAGEVFSAICSSKDITVRKQAELQRERLAAELAHKNKELESIVYATSHDLRSPLINIQGFGRRLSMDCRTLKAALTGLDLPADVWSALAPLLEENIPKSLYFITTSVEKMDSLIKGLLELSRVGRAMLKPEVLHMRTLLERVVASMHFQIEEVGGAIEIGDLPDGQGDADQINRVFSNLIDNALKYRDLLRPLKITVSGRVNGDESVYCIEDNGIGIELKQQEQIWELFHRLDPNGAIGGEGLGLTLVRTIIERHHGKIWVESTPGQGSRFSFSLRHSPIP